MSQDPMERYEVVIGLEVHTHLKTESKLFSPAPVRYGDAPNHDVHPIDLGMPGVLPVLNEKVIGLAIRLGLATHSTVNTRSVFSRKNYFYPDLPKGYQISQYEEPIVSDGWLDIDVPTRVDARSKKERSETHTKRIGVTRAHLEEDAGKSIHDNALTGSEGTQIDLNRAGVPLLEIVSEPDLRSAHEAVAYLRSLRSILRYLEVSDADMEKFGTRTEIENLNSFSSIEGAIGAEIIRQAEIIDDGGEVIQATMLYDVARNRTRVMRFKENADDYRYFDDPDLIPLRIDEGLIETIRADLPELPEQKRARFGAEYGLGASEIEVLVASRAMADFFEETVAACGSPKSAANWISRDLRKEVNERGVEIEAVAISPESLAGLIRLVEEGRLTTKSAQRLLPDLVEEGGDPEVLMSERGLEAVSDTGLIDTLVDDVVAAHEEAVTSVREGDDKPLNFLMGKVMKASQGKANPAEVRNRLIAKIRGASS